MHLAISWLLAAVLLMASAAQAQSNPMAAILAALDKPEPSQALDARAYRADAARHIYQHFRPLVHRGPLPAALQDIAILETTIDEQGAVEKVEVVREPSSGRATPWIVALIQAAQPYPVAALQGRVVYRDTWLITNEGRFQLDAISEGSQPQSASAARAR